MMKHSIISRCLLVAFAAAIFSCAGGEVGNEIEYLPFKSSENGKWGLIGTDGKLLFEDEFKDAPTSARLGRFLVRNGNGMWEIYSAEEHPQKIGDEYLAISDFTASVTPAVKKNEKINLIDVNGNSKVTLDKVNGKNIVSCSRFTYGYATIALDNQKTGIINTNGDVVIEPRYGNIAPLSRDKFCALDYTDKDGVTSVKILDKNANVIMSLRIGEGQRYIDLDVSVSTSDYLAVCTSVDGEPQWGYIDYNKDVVIRPTSKIKSISGVNGDKFIYNDGKNYGVMNFRGDVVLRPRYDNLSWASNDVLIAFDSDSKYSLINADGDKLTKNEYLSVLPYFDGKHAVAKVDDNGWVFVDKKGEEVKMKGGPDIYDITDNSADGVVESDFIDIDAIVSKLRLEKNGMLGFSLDMWPQQIVKAYNEVDGNTNDRLGLTPADNEGRDKVETVYSARGLEIRSALSYQRYMTENVDGNTVWSKEHPEGIVVGVSGEMINGKTNQLYAKVAATVKSFGKVVKENSGAVVVRLTNDRGWVVANLKDGLLITVINSRDYLDASIDEYAKDGETTREYQTGQAQESVGDAGTSASVVEKNDVSNYREQEIDVAPVASKTHSTIDGSHHLSGAISKYGITMDMTINGNSVSGSYYYHSQGSKHRLTIVGYVQGNNMELEEYAPDGSNTGGFVGVFNGKSYKGTFSNYNRGTSMSFSLSE